LAPLGPRLTPPEGIDRWELERRMTPIGTSDLPNDVKDQLDRGGIGMVCSYQGKGANGDYQNLPEDAKSTRCYFQENLAKSRKCPTCSRNFVFAKQGH